MLAVETDADILQRDGRADGRQTRARNRIRTGDPFLTMEVLYQLSYPGVVELPAGYRSAYPG